MNTNQMQTMQMNQMKMSQNSTEAAAALNKNQFLPHYAPPPTAPPPPSQPHPMHFQQPQATYQKSKPKSAYQEKKKKKKKGHGEEGDDVDQRQRWTKDEDRKLRAAVAAIGPKNWKRISQEFLDEQRSDVQCLYRWDKVQA